MSNKNSSQLYQQALQFIPGGVNSPVRAFKGVGGNPLFFKAGEGAYLIDVDDNRYVDYVGAWGPLILGHRHQSVLQAIATQLEQGIAYGASTEAEVQIAEKICQLLPSVERVRLVTSGTEATSERRASGLCAPSSTTSGRSATTSRRPGTLRSHIAAATPSPPRGASSIASTVVTAMAALSAWCVPCIAEAPQLEELAKRGVPIVGIAIRDEPEAIAQFLEQYGDPYAAIARDDIAEVQLALGSSGVPETFVIDGKGIIRHQHIGDIRESDVDEIYAKWEAAK